MTREVVGSAVVSTARRALGQKKLTSSPATSSLTKGRGMRWARQSMRNRSSSSLRVRVGVRASAAALAPREHIVQRRGVVETKHLGLGEDAAPAPPPRPLRRGRPACAGQPSPARRGGTRRRSGQGSENGGSRSAAVHSRCAHVWRCRSGRLRAAGSATRRRTASGDRGDAQVDGCGRWWVPDAHNRPHHEERRRTRGVRIVSMEHAKTPKTRLPFLNRTPDRA